MLKSLHRLAWLTGLFMCLIALGAAAALAGSASAEIGLPALPNPVSKIPQPVTRVLTGRISLPSTLPTLPSAAKLLGATPTSAPARVLISLAHRNEPQLEGFIARVSDPGSASYGHYLRPRSSTPATRRAPPPCRRSSPSRAATACSCGRFPPTAHTCT